MNSPRFAVIAGLILAAAASRLLPHPPNFTPVGALALFGGACLADKRLAFLVPLAAMFLSDLVLGLHRGMPVIYLCFALVVCLGFRLRCHRRPLPVAAAAVAGALLFYLVSNFGVWARGRLYPLTLDGLATCYGAALPFLQNMLLGNLVYAALLFGGLAVTEQRFPNVREPQPALP